MKNSMLVPIRMFLLVITVLLSAASSFGQSVLDNGSSVGLAPGVPGGSYSLSDIDNINLFNGNLNLTLPLMKIGGRGEAGMVMSLPIESHWTNLYFFENPMGGFFNPIPQYNFPNGLEPGYGPGVLMLRGARHNFGLFGGGQFGDKYQTRSRLVDSSEVDLAGTLGHEATHAADFDVLAKTWVVVRNQQGKISADDFLLAFAAIRYNSEYNAFMVSGAVHQALEPNKPSTVWGNTPIRARYQLPWTIGELHLWNPAWATLDAAKIETIRGMNVDSTLMTPKKEGGHYGLQPPPK